jgi:DNA-binding transcriptional MerR regulator
VSDNLTIGQVAQRVGTTAKTVRYYETIGLLPEVDRAPNGYRRFRTDDLNRIRFIRHAKSLGLTLEEIRVLTSVAEHGECQRITAELKDIVESKIQECDERIASLTAFRASLEQLSQKINADEHDHHDAHKEGHPPFSPRCTCLPDLA